jgi:all-trans-retinol dehydrogenase (NAD+)
MNQLKDLVLSPLLTGPLLLAITVAPDTIRDGLRAVTAGASGGKGHEGATEETSAIVDFTTITIILQVLLIVGIISQLHETLSIMARNSWRLSPAKGWNWPDEIAIITGGSSGIGKEIALRFAALGIRTAVLDIQDLHDDLKDNERIAFFRCDVTSTESIAAAADGVRALFGHPTILINNAGVSQPVPIMKTTAPFLQKIMGVNLMSHWFTVQEFVPHMIEQNKGHIVSLASVASFVALSPGGDYSVTKAGVLCFHENLTCELKHFHKADNILTTIVHPMFVRTPLVQDIMEGLESAGQTILTPEDVAERVVAQIKSKRGGQLIIGAPSIVVSCIRAMPAYAQELIRGRIGRRSAPRWEGQLVVPLNEKGSATR